jgi:hypothetical protein
MGIAYLAAAPKSPFAAAFSRYGTSGSCPPAVGALPADEDGPAGTLHAIARSVPAGTLTGPLVHRDGWQPTQAASVYPAARPALTAVTPSR